MNVNFARPTPRVKVAIDFNRWTMDLVAEDDKGDRSKETIRIVQHNQEVGALALETWGFRNTNFDVRTIDREAATKSQGPFAEVKVGGSTFKLFQIELHTQ